MNALHSEFMNEPLCELDACVRALLHYADLHVGAYMCE